MSNVRLLGFDKDVSTTPLWYLFCPVDMPCQYLHVIHTLQLFILSDKNVIFLCFDGCPYPFGGLLVCTSWKEAS